MPPQTLLRLLPGLIVCLAFVSPAWAALPGGWANADVGSVTTAGTAHESGGTFTLTSAGATMNGNTNQHHFAYQVANGDCSIITRVATMTNTSTNAKAGIMIRENTAQNGAFAYLGMSPSWGSNSVGHPYNQNWFDAFGGGSGTAPYWLKLVRTGNNFVVSTSPNGTTWTTFGTYVVPMGPSVLIGLMAYSNSASVITATFDNITMTGVASINSGPNGWTPTDIGSTGALGNYGQTNGVYTVQGAGATIWGTTEQYHYVWRPLTGNGSGTGNANGNGSIIARVTSQGNTGWYGRAGVAIRSSLDSNATTLYLARRYDNKFNVQYHPINDGWSNPIDTAVTPALPNPSWVKLERLGNQFTSSYSTNGVSWTVYNTVQLNMGKEAHIGLMVHSTVNGSLNTATFDNVSTTGTDLLTAGWTSQDIGTVGLAGLSKEMDVFTIKGAGTGFAGNTDSGQFAYRAVTGDTQIVARVASQTGATSTTAQAAVMIRDSLTPDSKNAVLSISPDNVLRFQAHLNAADTTSTTTTTAGVNLPYWIKIARVGNVITGYYSADGWNWAAGGSATITMNPNAYIGLAVSSKSTSELNTVIYDRVSVGPVSNLPPTSVPILTDITSATQNPAAGLVLLEEINTATTAPVYESAAGVSAVEQVAGRSARVMSTVGALGDTAATIAYVIGQNKGLVAGNAYVLTVEYPDDTPSTDLSGRSIFITNRGADYTRGFATGTATGDARNQYAEPSVESLNYPRTGQWQTYRQYFHLLDRFQGIAGTKVTTTGGRPYLPGHGFHVAITRLKTLNDPRSAGAAVGYIRLYAVTNPSALYAPINYPPPNLPRRSIFWREEMADGLLQYNNNQNPDLTQNAVSDPALWYQHKMKMAKILGINTFAKDLLEFGYNQGWQTGDQNWAMEANDPARDLWTKLVPLATTEGLNVMPYFEYKSGIGLYGQGLAYERRAHKLYHNLLVTNGNSASYDNVWWSDNTNADLTDPATLVDAKRMLDRTVGDFKTKGKFNGIWFRMRGNCLPMSFADPTIDRYIADNPGDSGTTQASLISSYESDKQLYNRYVDWWFTKRVAFLTALRDYLRNDLGQTGAQVIFTPWTGEAVPTLHGIGQPFGHPGVVSDDPTWWTTYSNSLGEGYWKYHWQPTVYSTVGPNDLYRLVLNQQTPINDPNSWNVEAFHSSPNADPLRYTNLDGVMMSFPAGRLFTLERADALSEYRCASGLTVIRHYALNEDDATGSPDVPSPFDGQLGYLSMDCDRAGHHTMLQQARAVAQGDPTNLGYLCASSFSTGFPEIMRRFNQAFLAVPALPSTVVAGAASNAAVVVRRITTTGQGTYFYVVNTSMNPVTGVTVTLTGTGTVKNLVTLANESGTTLTLNLDSAELRAYRVGP